MSHSLRHAQWSLHPPAVTTLSRDEIPHARQVQAWLADTGSMTLKLKARTKDFSVRLLHQHPVAVLADEYAPLSLPARHRVIERDVVLHTDGRPVVFGHTVISTQSVKTDWPFFSKLGTTPLGANLFFDPLVRRSPIQYAELHASHPLMRRVIDALGADAVPATLRARRSLFKRKGGVMMVTDIFLPAIYALMRADRPTR